MMTTEDEEQRREMPVMRVPFSSLETSSSSIPSIFDAIDSQIPREEERTMSMRTKDFRFFYDET